MSGQTEHTPGPWEVGVDGDGKPGYVYCNNALGSAVAIVYGDPLRFTAFSRKEEEANARLIAAAPELLDALIAVVAVADRATVEFDKARAVIAKATRAAATLAKGEGKV